MAVSAFGYVDLQAAFPHRDRLAQPPGLMSLYL